MFKCNVNLDRISVVAGVGACVVEGVGACVPVWVRVWVPGCLCGSGCGCMGVCVGAGVGVCQSEFIDPNGYTTLSQRAQVVLIKTK